MVARARRGRRARTNEVEYLHGLHCIREALRARRRVLHRLLLRRDLRRREIDALIEDALSADVPVESVDVETIARLGSAGESNPQGVLLAAGPLPEHRCVGDLLAEQVVPAGGRRLVALDGVEDPRNVGAIARVADAAGAQGLILCERRAPPLSPALARASAGAIEWLPVARVGNLGRAFTDLAAEGFWLVGADPESDASLFELEDRLLSGDLVGVLGAEGRGLRPGVRQRIDHPVRIPMRGRVASLNVAAACAVILYEVQRRPTGGSR